MRSAKSASEWVEIRITAAPLPPSCPARRRARSNPLSSPRVMSTRTTFGRNSAVRRSACAAVSATPTTRRPSRSRRTRAVSRNNWLSSTIRTPKATRTESQLPPHHALLLAGIRSSDDATGVSQVVRWEYLPARGAARYGPIARPAGGGQARRSSAASLFPSDPDSYPGHTPRAGRRGQWVGRGRCARRFRRRGGSAAT